MKQLTINIPEEWRAVVGYEGLYEVSSLGRVRTVDRVRQVRCRGIVYPVEIPSVIRKPRLIRGYLRIGLYSNGKYKSFAVHRILATAFIPNQECKDFVNHIDGDKLNNILANLEWVTAFENHLHANDTFLIPLHKRRNQIVAFNAEGSIWFSAKKYAWNEYPFNVESIFYSMKDGRPHNGYIWMRLEQFLSLPAEVDIRKLLERKGKKLSQGEARSIRTRALSGENYATIARDYQVTRNTIGDIKAGRIWRDA